VKQRAGGIFGVTSFSHHTGTPDDIVRSAGVGQYDLSLLAPSWDARCLAITATDPAFAGRHLVLRYDNAGVSNRQTEHAKRIGNWLAGSEVTNVPGSSAAVLQFWRRIRSQIVEAARKKGHPLDVFVDMSTIPRVVSLALAGDLLLRRYVYSISYLYVEANYEPVPKQGPVFTHGRWRNIQVPGLLGTDSARLERKCIVSLGFDGEDTHRLVNAAEPVTVAAVLAAPGVTESTVALAEERNRPLLEDWVSPELVFRVPAVDVQGMAESVGLISQEFFPANLYYFCMGTKPHALGMALGAIYNREAAVVYRVPDRYQERATERTDRAHLYRVHNRASLGRRAYLDLLRRFPDRHSNLLLDLGSDSINEVSSGASEAQSMESR
jgi:hypothetical protein